MFDESLDEVLLQYHDAILKENKKTNFNNFLVIAQFLCPTSACEIPELFVGFHSGAKQLFFVYVFF